MFKWLFRIGLGFLALKLAETYKSPWRGTKEKPLPDRPAPKRRKKDSARTTS
jgi:hypothetical protein